LPALLGAVTRFCPACQRFRELAEYYPKQARCKSCSLAAKQARRAENPGRDAELKRAQRARAKLRQQTAEKALWHIVSGHRRIIAEFADDLATDRADELADELAGLFLGGVAAAEDELGLEPGSALKILARRQDPRT
jgi:SBP domain